MADLKEGQVEKHRITPEMRSWLKERKKTDAVAKMVQQKFLEVQGQAKDLKTLMKAISISYKDLDENSPRFPLQELQGMDFSKEDQNIEQAEGSDFMIQQ